MLHKSYTTEQIENCDDIKDIPIIDHKDEKNRNASNSKRLCLPKKFVKSMIHQIAFQHSTTEKRRNSLSSSTIGQLKEKNGPTRVIMGYELIKPLSN